MRLKKKKKKKIQASLKASKIKLRGLTRHKE